MKYEVMKAEIIRVQNEDVLTLSLNDNTTKKTASWDSLGFVDPMTGKKI